MGGEGRGGEERGGEGRGGEGEQHTECYNTACSLYPQFEMSDK